MFQKEQKGPCEWNIVSKEQSGRSGQKNRQPPNPIDYRKKLSFTLSKRRV